MEQVDKIAGLIEQLQWSIREKQKEIVKLILLYKLKDYNHRFDALIFDLPNDNGTFQDVDENILDCWIAEIVEEENIQVLIDRGITSVHLAKQSIFERNKKTVVIALDPVN